MKRMCGMCYEFKEETEFRINKHTVNGKEYKNLDSYCKSCRRAYDSDRHRIQRARRLNRLEAVLRSIEGR